MPAYERAPHLDTRIALGDDFASDAYIDIATKQVHRVVVGRHPDELRHDDSIDGPVQDQPAVKLPWPEPYPCRCCGKAREKLLAELCDECAKGNDPFVQSKYSPRP